MKTEYTFFFEMGILVIYGFIISCFCISSLIRKQPAIISNLLYFGPLLLIFIGMYSNILFLEPFSLKEIKHLDISELVFPITMIVMLIVMIYFIGKQLFGYFVIGVGDEFGEAIIQALQENNIQYQEKLSRIILPEYNTQINVAVTKWMGTAQIRIDSGKNRKLLRKVIDSVKNYYSKQKFQRTSLLIFTIFGIIIIISGVLLSIFMIRLYI